MKGKNSTGGNGFFDYEVRLHSVKEKKRPLDELKSLIPWDIFRIELENILPDVTSRGLGGRPPFARLLMFKILVLQRYYQLSDAEMEFQLKDRFSFQDFVEIGSSGKIPDEKTIWLFREQLRERDGLERLFQRFDDYLNANGIIAREGTIIDASFVHVPKQRNSREENAKVKKGETPDDWEDNPNKLRQKDVDARWSKKDHLPHYGYKNHIKIDAKSKLILASAVTPSNTHDSLLLEELLDDKDKVLYADSAYRSVEMEEFLQKRGIESHIHEKGSKTRPLNATQKENNRIKSKTRARVEHIFGFMHNSMDDKISRYIGLKRTEAAVTLKNLVYNLFRYEQLVRLGGVRP